MGTHSRNFNEKTAQLMPHSGTLRRIAIRNPNPGAMLALQKSCLAFPLHFKASMGRSHSIHWTRPSSGLIGRQPAESARSANPCLVGHTTNGGHSVAGTTNQRKALSETAVRQVGDVGAGEAFRVIRAVKAVIFDVDSIRFLRGAAGVVEAGGEADSESVPRRTRRVEASS